SGLRPDGALRAAALDRAPEAEMKALLIALPFVLLLAGLPIFIILLTTATLALALVMNVPLAAVPQMMFGSIDKFSLLAVPFFIFAGEILSHGGISERLMHWVQSIFGGVRGSVALTTVGTFELFCAISGSSRAAPTERFPLARFLHATRESIRALLAPVIILGSIYGGICTPTETAGIACVYAAFVTRFIYRSVTWRRLVELPVSSAILTGQIM